MEDKLKMLNLKIMSARSESIPDLSERLFCLEELANLDDLATSCTVDVYVQRKTQKVLNNTYQLDQTVLKEIFEKFSKDGNLEQALHGIACLLRFGTEKNLGQLALQANTKTFLEGLLHHITGYLKCIPNNTYEAGKSTYETFLLLIVFVTTINFDYRFYAETMRQIWKGMQNNFHKNLEEKRCNFRSVGEPSNHSRG